MRRCVTRPLRRDRLIGPEATELLSAKRRRRSLKPRVAIIGGGITGAFAAFFLARLGAEATIIERASIGAGASGNNAGGLNPLQGPGIPGPMQALALESLRLHLDNWNCIQRLSGIDFEGRFVRRLTVAMDEGEARLIAGREELYNATAGFSARWLSARELRRYEGRLARQAVGGLLTEGNARVDPSAYTTAVATAAVRLGARTVTGEALGLRHCEARVEGVRLDHEEVPCDAVVLASGPWSKAPARWLGVELPVEPVKGELLLAELQTAAPAAEITWRQFGVYFARGERVWLGGTDERAGFDRTPSDLGRQRIIAGISRLLPDLASPKIIRHLVGLRPVTPDGLPIIGMPRAWKNVCVALGGGRKGLLVSAGLGLACAEILTGGETRIDIAGCQLERAGLSS